MNEKNKIKEPLILMGYLSVFLIFLTIFKSKLSIGNWLHPVDVFSDVRNKPTQLPIQLITSSNSLKKNILLPQDSTLFADYGVGTTTSLVKFYKKLNQLQQGKTKIRIAYFGDSFIEGDRITSDIRFQLQKLFGGNGIGFLPVYSNLANQYTQLKMHSDGWLDYNFTENPKKYPLGLMGHVFYPIGSTEVIYEAIGSQSFNSIKLYTGPTDNARTVDVEIDGNPSIQAINGNSLVNETNISAPTPIKKIKIATSDETLPFYGVSLEDQSGIYIDNYAFRGNSGIETQKLTPELITQQNSFFNYDLIILGYGLNALEHNAQKFDWYEQSMNKVIAKFKNGFTNTPILLISIADVSYKYDGVYSTEKAVPFMVAIQQRIAEKNNIAFWNLYQTIGGENTMLKWVKGDTIFGAPDYTHVTDKGAKKIATLFVSKLLASKAYYESLKPIKK